MTPRRRRGTGGRGSGTPMNEAARLTQQLLDAGFTRKDVANVIGRDPSLVSQFFSKGKGGSFVEALTYAVQEFQTGNATTVDQLKAVAQPYVQRRTTSSGGRARVRSRDVIGTPGRSSAAKAGKQHIASGAGRLRPVVTKTAAAGGKLAFTVRARKGAFLIDSGRRGDSPGVRRGVVQRKDGSEERNYGNSAGPGLGEAGFDAAEWAQRVEDADGDVAAAFQQWMVETGRLAPDAQITHLQVRGWVE